MCLYVKNKPKKIESLIFPCWKRVSIDYRYDTIKVYYTPYQGITIPNNGWLYPHQSGVRKICSSKQPRDFLDYGVIHAYCSKKFHDSINLYRAFAFNVVAYGDNGDLGCLALYIPSLDFTKERRPTVKKIKYLLSKGSSLRTKQVIKEFPMLERDCDIAQSVRSKIARFTA